MLIEETLDWTAPFVTAYFVTKQVCRMFCNDICYYKTAPKRKQREEIKSLIEFGREQLPKNETDLVGPIIALSGKSVNFRPLVERYYQKYVSG